jgi:hypothetical protein
MSMVRLTVPGVTKHTELVEKEILGVIDHADASVTPAKLRAVDTPADGEAPLYDAASGKFRWEPAGVPFRLVRTFKSGAALAANVFVYVDAAGKVQTSSVIYAPKTVGVSLNSASAANQDVDVCILGACQVIAGESLVIGDPVKVGTYGYAYKMTRGHVHTWASTSGTDATPAAHQRISTYDSSGALVTPGILFGTDVAGKAAVTMYTNPITFFAAGQALETGAAGELVWIIVKPIAL